MGFRKLDAQILNTAKEITEANYTKVIEAGLRQLRAIMGRLMRAGLGMRVVLWRHQVVADAKQAQAEAEFEQLRQQVDEGNLDRLRRKVVRKSCKDAPRRKSSDNMTGLIAQAVQTPQPIATTALDELRRQRRPSAEEVIVENLLGNLLAPSGENSDAVKQEAAAQAPNSSKPCTASPAGTESKASCKPKAPTWAKKKKAVAESKPLLGKARSLAPSIPQNPAQAQLKGSRESLTRRARNIQQKIGKVGMSSK